jgi:hypothetical protein
MLNKSLNCSLAEFLRGEKKIKWRKGKKNKSHKNAQVQSAENNKCEYEWMNGW